MGRTRAAFAATAIGAVLLVAQSAPAETPAAAGQAASLAPSTSTVPSTTPGGTLNSPDPVQPGATLAAPPPPRKPVQKPGSGGGVSAPENDAGVQNHTHSRPQQNGGVGASPAGTNPFPLSTPTPSFGVPGAASASCITTSPPPGLLPIYQRAAATYSLGPQGPSVLAAINQIETNFGELNHVTSSAGAVGWMQFMPSTWASYGVDANGDGRRDPYDPEDAIFAAASYLRASGMPEDTAGAIYAYNHADWYVSEVLANAGCFGSLDGSSFTLEPQIQVLTCKPAKGWDGKIPSDYLSAFEAAAGRYNLGRRGVWALAAVARLESRFGRGMSKAELRRSGPLGLDPTEWRRYSVDGDGDSVVRHSSVGDSAATLARIAWARGGLKAGIFTHNQAQWYVQEVLDEADRMAGSCKVRTVPWKIRFPEVTSSAINWSNLTLSNSLEKHDLDTGA
ncbi:MAG: lytic murein transglycosylase, partial [Solirubrobacterales bacterium]